VGVPEAWGLDRPSRLKRVSQPYAPGEAVYWTTYTYDALGRITQVDLPGGTGSTTYVYEGNTVKVTDPAGKWRKYTVDAMGNLVQVSEPAPEGGTHETYYSYNVLKQLTQVSLPRGGYTQTRTFNYDLATGRLASATNPENGTVTYTYNNDGTLQKRTDARGQRVEYTYDEYQRVTVIRRFLASGQEDYNQRVTFTYDWNTADPEFTQYGWGRVVAVEYWQPLRGYPATFTEMYSYTPAGLKTKKRLRMAYGSLGTPDLDAVYAYDNEGRVTSLTYPTWDTLNYEYDAMGRPSKLTRSDGQVLASDVVYGPAGELRQASYPKDGSVYLGYTETRSYNARLQLTRLTARTGYYFPVTLVDLEYRYSATQNNGQATQMKDWVSGEEVTYAYDALTRLISAVTTGPEWGQSFSYDGWGNMTGQTVTKGTAPNWTLNYDPATNRIVTAGYGYDASGNLTAAPWGSFSYDAENRLVWANPAGPPEHYGYGPDHRRVVKGGLDYKYVYFSGVDGAHLATYRIDPLWHWEGEVERQVYFAGRKGPITDRVGSVRARQRLDGTWEQLSYYPYGQERQTTAQDRDKFATYRRDATNLDYAVNRYYASTIGRFLTPDPYRAARRGSPQSWNKFAYVRGDPVNRTDPRGLFPYPAEFGVDYEDDTGDAISLGISNYERLMGDWQYGGGGWEPGSYPWWSSLPMTAFAPYPEQPGGRGGGDEEGAYRPECDRDVEKNSKYLDFISAHGTDAQKLASLLGVTVQNVLGVSIEETGFGTSRIALEGNNYFGIHAPKTPFPGQTGTITTRADGKMAAFSKATGFYDSGAAFVQIESPYVKGVADPTQFANILHKHGYGVTNPNYARELVNIIGNVGSRIDCPK